MIKRDVPMVSSNLTFKVVLRTIHLSTQVVEVISSQVTTKMLKEGVDSVVGYYRKVHVTNCYI